jgi:biopolymer transport protein ExbB/biopolymer transport protein TolQ
MPEGVTRERVFGAREMAQKTNQASGEAQALDICPMGIWRHMSRVTIIVLFILLVMSIWAIVIMVERYVTFTAATNQSREFAPKVASSLNRQKIDEAISLSDKYKKSHLAMVVNAGLQEFRAHQISGDISGEVVEASKCALQRATAIKIAEFRRGLSGLATIGSTAIFVGLFGTLFGIIKAVEGMGESAWVGISTVAGGIAEALVTTAVGLAVSVPAVWLFKYFTIKVDKFTVEMDISSAELIDFFLKQRGMK